MSCCGPHTPLNLLFFTWVLRNLHQVGGIAKQGSQASQGDLMPWTSTARLLQICLLVLKYLRKPGHRDVCFYLWQIKSSPSIPPIYLFVKSCVSASLFLTANILAKTLVKLSHSNPTILTSTFLILDL